VKGFKSAFFELFTLPLSDINEQNTRMQNGEKSQKQIERHAGGMD
jgi:glycine betaine/proline transport system substrate-binding protein